MEISTAHGCISLQAKLIEQKNNFNKPQKSHIYLYSQMWNVGVVFKETEKNYSDKIRDWIILVASNSMENTTLESIPRIQYPAHRYCMPFVPLPQQKWFCCLSSKMKLLKSKNQIKKTNSLNLKTVFKGI